MPTSTPKSLAEALLAFQKDAPDLQKNAINPHFGKKYLTLEELTDKVLPKLNALGVLVLQWPTCVERETAVDGTVKLGTASALRTKLIHVPSGDSMEDVMPLILEKDSPQKQGSAITYARRYALMSTLGLTADEDDDGNAASPKGNSGETKQYDPSGPPPF